VLFVAINWLVEIKVFMKKIILCYLVLIVAINSFAAARIECVNKVFDFGIMHDGQSAEHIFTIKNTGDEELAIGKIRACCGSTAVISSKSIEPGKTATLTAKLPLLNRYGKQDKNIFIASNDPKTPYFQLKFIGDVQRRVTIEPRSVKFMDLKLGQKAEQVVTVTSTLPMNIIKIESSSKAFIASENTKGPIKKTSENFVPFVANIKISTVSDKLVKGMNRGTVTLHTDNKDYPKIRIYCRAQVEDSIKVTPSDILLKKSSKPVTRYVAVRADKPFKILEIKVPVEDINVTYKQRGTNAYLFVISNIPADEILVAKSIVIKTDYDNGREIEIPFSVKN